MNDPRNQKPSDKGVGSTGGSACSTRERKWRIRISDCYCEYEYELDARVDDVCIHDLYELVRERLKADDVHGRFVDPEEHPLPGIAELRELRKDKARLDSGEIMHRCCGDRVHFVKQDLRAAIDEALSPNKVI